MHLAVVENVENWRPNFNSVFQPVETGESMKNPGRMLTMRTDDVGKIDSMEHVMTSCLFQWEVENSHHQIAWGIKWVSTPPGFLQCGMASPPGAPTQPGFFYLLMC